ncbi:ABC transporter permease [Methylocystis sp. MJC1]|jgi:ABC-2 type transport system permease protein|uniref:ABC transporter permease n=1 Tax=Methylocystis sp. MJC1 TaxID=2654282 RepID=UPI0013ED145A|nr:ABC transporter permease [Methylocystis sp. MJC1]KAF2991233.1 Inner membrane transport permease YhhJ [Methylocystis sp. MJC1]MBU6526227.1 ABC transporter permease [Methylocystis sp. MJC1]UZX12681.1 ABC transporter permease [Methylocystis sp. MJC1]
MKSLLNIFWLGLKELRSLASDSVMLFFVAYAFTGSIYAQATGTSSEVNNASIAFVDEDRSALSNELINAFYPPRFQEPELITADEAEPAMDEGRYMFVVSIPPRFQSDLSAGRHPDIQLSIDATAMQQASIGAGYIKNIVNQRITSFFSRASGATPQPIDLVIRRLFNPNGVTAWFASIVGIINEVTILTIILTGAAVIREREHGTLEHLLVMPLTAFEIAMAKVWANSLVILCATAASLYLIVMKALEVPFAGSVALWFSGVGLYLFFATALGIFLGTVSRSMAQFALLIILVVVVLELLSGGNTPVESQPVWLQYITFFLPSRHFVSFSQKIIYRGGGLSAVWPQFVMVAAIGLAFFSYSLSLFRKSIAVTK